MDTPRTDWNRCASDRRATARALATLCLVSTGQLAACHDPTAIDVVPVERDGIEDCAASDEWLPDTAELALFKPAPHPTTECPFYRGVWNHFLLAMKPTDDQGTPALLNFPTVETMFKRTKVLGANRAYLGDIKQAGGRQILIDKNGNSLYYGIQANQAFADFITANHLDSAQAVQRYPDDLVKKNLFFPPGLVEFKDAWQIVEGTDAEVAALTDGFIWMKTTVPTLSQVDFTDAQGHPHKRIVEDRDRPRPVTVRLLAIHVVYTYPGHPEFIWGSMEHTNITNDDVLAGETDTKAADGHRDVAPAIGVDGGKLENPTSADPDNANNRDIVSNKEFIMYTAGTQARDGNSALAEDDLLLDPDTQKLTRIDKTPVGMSVYRMFPASKSNETDPDDAISSLNHNVEALFLKHRNDLPAGDRRGHYRLVGGQWMDKPGYFHADFPVQNNDSSPFVTGPYVDQEGKGHDKPLDLNVFTRSIDDDGSDSEFSILAGEDRMSSTVMETFTQGANAFNNCFQCHNTQAITAKGVPFNKDKGQGAIELLKPGLLNVSHILSQIVLEDCTDPEDLQDNGNGTFTAVCPPPVGGP